jgi:hypothetical protein
VVRQVVDHVKVFDTRHSEGLRDRYGILKMIDRRSNCKDQVQKVETRLILLRRHDAVGDSLDFGVGIHSFVSQLLLQDLFVLIEPALQAVIFGLEEICVYGSVIRRQRKVFKVKQPVDRDKVLFDEFFSVENWDLTV